MLAGAVYRPEELMVPMLGLMLQFTAGPPWLPVTVAANCIVWLAESSADAGVTVTLALAIAESKNNPLTTAFGPPVKVARIVTCPLTFQIRYTPS